MAEAAAAAAEAGLPVVEQHLRQCLAWIGFSALQRNRICAESVRTLEDVQSFDEKDIKALEESFSKRTPAAQRIIFGQRRTKALKSLVHWVKDFCRVDLDPTIEGLALVSFKDVIGESARRAEIRKEEIGKQDAVLKEASPGPLVTESKWHEWEEAMENYLNSTYGVDGVPLSYVIRPNDAADRVTTFTDFNDRAIACAPLTGPAFEADKRRVHQLLVAFTKGNPSEDWIKDSRSKRNGREDMKLLPAHFAGEGNATRRIAVAERLRDTLFYKNERSLTFELFCNKAQRMFNIFEQQKEPMTEEAKVRFLLKKVLHPQLSETVEALRTRLSTDPPGTITMTLVANHLASAVSELPEYAAVHRKVNAVGNGEVQAPASGVTLADGSIWTGYYPNWDQLSKEDVKKVMDERNRKRSDRKNKGKGGGNKNKDGGKKASDYKTELTQLKSVLQKRNRKIAALKKNNSDESEGSGNGGSDGSGDDAGNSFGGKRQKKKSKANN